MTSYAGCRWSLRDRLLSMPFLISSEELSLLCNIRILAPKALLLNAESNERDPHASMRVMGENLAKEVLR